MSRRKPEDTSKRSPFAHLLGASAMGSSNYIEEMEASGQKQLIDSQEIPRVWHGFTEKLLKELGFDVPPSPQTDRGDIFRPAVLPKGWSKKGSDHSMWSYIVDERGFRRFSIFYKAAFYDRSAFMNIERRFMVTRDYEAPKDTFTSVVMAAMPGGQTKTIFSFTYEKKFSTTPHQLTPEERAAHWSDMDEAEQVGTAACLAWLEDRFPGPLDPTKHWDVEL